MPHRHDQHPTNPDGTHQAHCSQCGTYVDDQTSEPAADFLCSACQESENDESDG